MTSERVLPVPDASSAPFWKAAAEHQLVLARCSRCHQWSHPPDVVCSRCHHPDPDFHFEPTDGAGTIRSWITLNQSFLPGFDDLPFILVDVALDDDAEIRLIGRLVDGPDVSLALGDRVRLTFETLSADYEVPAFELEQP